MKLVVDGDFRCLVPDAIKICREILDKIKKNAEEHCVQIINKIEHYKELLDGWSGVLPYIDCISDKKFQDEYSKPKSWGRLAAQEKDMVKLNRHLYLRRKSVEPREIVLLKKDFVKFRSEMMSCWEKSSASIGTYYDTPLSSLSEEDKAHLENEYPKKKPIEESPRDKRMRERHGDGWPILKDGEYWLHEHMLDDEAVSGDVYTEIESESFLKNPFSKIEEYQTWIEQLSVGGEGDSSTGATYQTLIHLLMVMKALLENNGEVASENMTQCRKVIGLIKRRNAKTDKVIQAVMGFCQKQWAAIPSKVGTLYKSTVQIQFSGFETQLNNKPLES